MNAVGARAVVLPFLLVAAIWGSTWIVIKDQISTTPPEWTIVWRFALAAAGMIVLALWRGDSLRLPPRAQAIALVLGLTQFCGNFQFVYRAEAFLPSGIVAIAYALLMVPNTLLAWALLGHRVSARFVGGSAVAIVGIGCLLAHEFRSAPPQGQILLGTALTAGGILCAAVANVTQALPAARPVGTVPLLAWAMVWGTVCNVAIAGVVAGLPMLTGELRYWGGVVYLALIGSVITFPLYFHLIRTMGAGRAAYNGVATPVVAMLLSTLFEGYRWTVLAAAGCVLALAGLALALSRRAG